MKRTVLAAVVVLSMALVGVAWAAVDPGADPGGWASFLLAAATGRRWALLAALVLVGAVWGLRRFSWAQGDRAGAALVLAGGMVQALAATLGSGQAVGAGVLLDALVAGFTAAGGYAVARKLLWPKG